MQPLGEELEDRVAVRAGRDASDLAGLAPESGGERGRGGVADLADVCGDDARDMRGCLAGAAVDDRGGVAEVPRRGDGNTRCPNVDDGAVVAERGLGVVNVMCTNGDGTGDTGRRGVGGVDVRVTSGDNGVDAGGDERGYCVINSGRGTTSERCASDRGTASACCSSLDVVETTDDVCEGARPVVFA